MNENTQSFESARGCGLRVIHGLYLFGWGESVICDRLKIVLEECKICGQKPRFSRGISKFDPYKLFGEHEECKCEAGPECPICHPEEDGSYFLMWVGSDYTEQEFIHEAQTLGFSKRIPWIPKDLVIGKSWVFFAKKNNTEIPLGKIVNKRGRKPMTSAIFYAVQPQEIHYLIKEEEATEEYLAELEKEGVTPITVPKKFEHLHKEGVAKTFKEEEDNKLENYY
jgi:hypothetical protein